MKNTLESVLTLLCNKAGYRTWYFTIKRTLYFLLNESGTRVDVYIDDNDNIIDLISFTNPTQLKQYIKSQSNSN